MNRIRRGLTGLAAAPTAGVALRDREHKARRNGSRQERFMDSLNAGWIRLFRVAGITVLLHWSWFLAALLEIRERQGTYGSRPGTRRNTWPCSASCSGTNWAAAGLPAGGGQGGANRSLAAGGRRFVSSAAAPRRLALEHRRRPLGERALVPVTIGGLLRCGTRARRDSSSPRSLSVWALAGHQRASCWFSTCCRSTRLMAGRSSMRCSGSCWAVPAACRCAAWSA